MKKTLALWALLAGAAAADERTFVRNYDVASTSFIYCETTNYVAGTGRVSTAGSTTTIDVAGAGAALRQLAAGDEIFVTRPNVGTSGTTTDRRVLSAAPTSNTSMIVTSAVDWTAGFSWQFRKVACGTGAENGWLPTARASWTNVKWVIASMSATSIDLDVECRDTGDSAGAATVVWPNPSNSSSTDECLKSNFTAANKCGLIIEGHWSECRVGLKVNTDTGTQDITATLNTGNATGVQ